MKIKKIVYNLLHWRNLHIYEVIAEKISNGKFFACKNAELR